MAGRKNEMDFDDLAKYFYEAVALESANATNELQTDNVLNCKLAEPIYGRICTTMDLGEPDKLSFIPGRKTAFVFGPETITNALLSRKPYDMLQHLGYLPEYIYRKVCQENRSFWLVLFRPEKIKVVRASWGGVVDFTKAYYPKAQNTLLQHLEEIKQHNVEFYEKQAGFKFIEAIKEPPDEMYMSYDKYVSLKKPVKTWQTRLFFYCELRLFELFKGDGYTQNDCGITGEKEYMCPNVEISKLGKGNYVILPMHVDVPNDVKKRFQDK
ncbi:uncharacterized protein LOC144344962 [Saccoglossus kowalevskii]